MVQDAHSENLGNLVLHCDDIRLDSFKGNKDMISGAELHTSAYRAKRASVKQAPPKLKPRRGLLRSRRARLRHGVKRS